MIQRQGCGDVLTVRLITAKNLTDKSHALLNVCHQVGVREHCAFCHARRAACVLQHRNVIKAKLWALIIACWHFIERVFKRNVIWNIPRWHHFFDVAHHRIDDDSFKAKHITQRRNDDVLYLSFVLHFFKGVGKVFHDE
ncbi:Uncharacterised protein [Moraxella caviae]|nr:Uncharacterised protein [Moraxella caviae]